MWIEFGEKEILVNLNNVSCIWQNGKKVELELISGEDNTIPQYFDTEEEAKARYEEIKGALPLLQRCETKNECIDEQTCNDEYEMLAKSFVRGPEVSE